MNSILETFETIGYYLQFFFCLPAPFAHIYKAVLFAQILFLIYAAIRPSKWKWITLFAAEFLYFIGAMMLIGHGFAQDSIGLLYYGCIAAVLNCITGFASLGFSLRNPIPRSSQS